MWPSTVLKASSPISPAAPLPTMTVPGNPACTFRGTITDIKTRRNNCEAGGCRMGNDPRTSVLDEWNRCHDTKNVLVVDAGCFVSHPEKQITHTIMALAYRASDHLAEEFRRGDA